MATGLKFQKYNAQTGMPAFYPKPVADIPNYGAMRNAALAGWTSPDGLNGLESLKQANAPGSSFPSSNSYEDMLRSAMAPYNSAVSSGLDARNASDNEARKRAAIAYGMLPADYASNPAYSWLDPLTADLVRKSTSEGVSTTARLGQQYKDALQTVQRVLASRGVGGGMLRSGETGYEQGRASLANKQNVFDAGQAFQDYLAGVAKANADYQMQQQKDLAAQQNTVAGQLLAANPNGSLATEQPPTPRVASAPVATNPYTTDIYKNLRTYFGH